MQILPWVSQGSEGKSGTCRKTQFFLHTLRVSVQHLHLPQDMEVADLSVPHSTAGCSSLTCPIAGGTEAVECFCLICALLKGSEQSSVYCTPNFKANFKAISCTPGTPNQQSSPWTKILQREGLDSLEQGGCAGWNWSTPRACLRKGLLDPSSRGYHAKFHMLSFH